MFDWLWRERKEDAPVVKKSTVYHEQKFVIHRRPCCRFFVLVHGREGICNALGWRGIRRREQKWKHMRRVRRASMRGNRR